MKPRVGLFVTCLVDLMRPSVGFAAAKLIEASGCDVAVPAGQTCCGQPAFNSGDKADARALALATMGACDGCDYVVAPSGSCAAMMKLHYPQLMAGDESAQARARAFALTVYELSSFLVTVRRMTAVPGRFDGRVAYHDACHLAHAQKIRSQPRKLLEMIPGLELVALEESEICCGAAGTYNLTEPEMAERLAVRKHQNIEATGAQAVFTANAGCLLQIGRKIREAGLPIWVAHPVDPLDLSYRRQPLPREG